MPEAIVPKVGHGPKMGQSGFDRACFSVVFLFLLCFIAHSYEANGMADGHGSIGLLQARFFEWTFDMDKYSDSFLCSLWKKLILFP